jgi:hypothetical protein
MTAFGGRPATVIFHGDPGTLRRADDVCGDDDVRGPSW